MAFKLEKYTGSTLKNLQNENVSELLGEHIPEDEAKLLSNGRYTCLVCDYRPIFDTIAVLTHHRKGNKHTHYFKQFLTKKKEISDLIDKRIQLNSLSARSSSGRMSVVGADLGSGHRLNLKLQSKTIGKGKNLHLRRKIINVSHGGGANVDAHTERNVDGKHEVLSQYIKEASRKKHFGDVVETQKYSYLSRENNDRIPDVINTMPSIENKSTSNMESSMQKKENKPKIKKHPKDLSELEKIKYYQNLRASGWCKDWSGNWIQDPNAEFDSDEEEPSEFIEKT